MKPFLNVSKLDAGVNTHTPSLHGGVGMLLTPGTQIYVWHVLPRRALTRPSFDVAWVTPRPFTQMDHEWELETAEERAVEVLRRQLKAKKL